MARLAAAGKGRLEDRVLRIEAGKAEHADNADTGDRQRAGHHRPEGERDVFPQAAIIAHVLLVVHRVDHRAAPRNSSALKKAWVNRWNIAAP